MTLHALIFALVFALLGFGIDVVLNNILGFSEGNLAADSSQGSGGNSSAGSTHTVDITIQEEDLPIEENAPAFFVGNNHQMLNTEDTSSSPINYSSSKEQSSAVDSASNTEVKLVEELPALSVDSDGKTAESQEFVPVSLANDSSLKLVDNEKSAVKAEINKPASAETPIVLGNGEELGVLPDLEDVTGGVPASSGNNSEDSGYYTQQESAPAETSFQAKENPAEGQDAAVMAKAISTLLAKQ